MPSSSTTQGKSHEHAQRSHRKKSRNYSPRQARWHTAHDQLSTGRTASRTELGVSCVESLDNGFADPTTGAGFVTIFLRPEADALGIFPAGGLRSLLRP